MRLALALVLAQVLLASQAARADDGKVDWERKLVRCTGSGAANLKDADFNPAVARIGAEKAARLDALRNCLAALRGVQPESGRTVGGALESDAALLGRVEGLVRGFRVVGKPRYFSEAGREVCGPSARRFLGDRPGDRPLLVKAVRVEGSDVVISSSDAAALAGPFPALLGQGRVVILAD